ncbi:unnamed protein product [Lactuca virosa]|uniref:No apical meristem-associated C-terminal domain-containing protein n=1 Tax=Lactuca virosa TaxID=75947 RepID=A0AAU9NZQ6_9ASTR|nr:unnamed protein product [Lactuca virosa]
MGTGQNRDQFWLRITKQFCKGMGRDPDYWTSDQCNSKWNVMKKLLKHWNGIYTNFEKQWVSGESENEFVVKTYATFQDDMLKPLKFIYVWQVVKINIRWRELATHEEITNPSKRSRTSSYWSSQQVSTDGHVGVNLNDGTTKARARGKGKGTTTSSNSSIRTKRSTRSEEMMAQMAQLNSTFERHMAETIRLTECSLLMQDERHIDPEDQEAAKTVKVSIRKKHKLNIK